MNKKVIQSNEDCCCQHTHAHTHKQQINYQESSFIFFFSRRKKNQRIFIKTYKHALGRLDYDVCWEKKISCLKKYLSVVLCTEKND